MGPSIDTAERRRRVVVRQFLRDDATDIAAVAGALVGVHASDPATMFLALRARIAGFTSADLEAALYDDRTVVRMLGMRRTMFVVPPDLAAVMDAACTRAVAAAERRRLEKLVREQGPAVDPGPWLAEISERVLAHLAAHGETPATGLTKAVPELATKYVMSPGKAYEGTVGLSTRLLFLLASEGAVVRGRPLGSWLSSQHRWARTETWLGAPLDDWTDADARTELARRWLRAFGPATLDDVKWWTGWPLGHTRTALAAVGAVEVALDDRTTGLVLPDDLEPTVPPSPSVALLPGLDPTPMGWKQRDWYLAADHVPRLFDRNGNVGPTIWSDGCVVGGWVQRPDGEVATELLTDVGADVRQAVGAEAERLRAWFGEVRYQSRFPTPLEKELRA